jgi:hypothetical protein
LHLYETKWKVSLLMAKRNLLMSKCISHMQICITKNKTKKQKKLSSQNYIYDGHSGACEDFCAIMKKCMNANVILDFCTWNVKFALLKMYTRSSSLKRFCGTISCIWHFKICIGFTQFCTLTKHCPQVHQNRKTDLMVLKSYSSTA